VIREISWERKLPVSSGGGLSTARVRVLQIRPDCHAKSLAFVARIAAAPSPYALAGRSFLGGSEVKHSHDLSART